MKRRHTILLLVVVGIFLIPGVSSADFFTVDGATYLFLNEDGDLGAKVSVLVEAEESAAAEAFWTGMGTAPGTYYLYRYTYQVDNTGVGLPDDVNALPDIGWFTFAGGVNVDFGTNPGTPAGDVDVTLTSFTDILAPFYGEYRFDFDVGEDETGLDSGETSFEFWITSYFSGQALRDNPYYDDPLTPEDEYPDNPDLWGDAELRDGGVPAFGDLTSDLLVPSGSPISTTPVPEPGTLLLLGSGLLTAACFRRFRKKK